MTNFATYFNILLAGKVLNHEIINSVITNYSSVIILQGILTVTASEHQASYGHGG